VVDGATRYAMVERFRYEENATYPGKASVIFWTKRSRDQAEQRRHRVAQFGSRRGPLLSEAEINSPMCHLRPARVARLRRNGFQRARERLSQRDGSGPS